MGSKWQSFKRGLSYGWKKVWGVFATDLGATKTLYLMQVREKLDFSYLKSAKKSIGKIGLFLAEFIVIAAIAYLVLWFCNYLGIFSPLGIIPVSVMGVVFTVLFLFSVISCMITLSRDLFSAKDNVVLETYPVAANDIYLSKLAVNFVKECRRTLLFYVPIFFAYALLCGMAWYAYFWMLLVLLIFTVFELLLAGVLALPVYYIVRFFRQYNILKIVVAVLFVAILIGAVVYLVTLIPSDINLVTSWASVSSAMRNFLDWFDNAFYIFYAFTAGLCGLYTGIDNTFWTNYSWSVQLIVIGCIIVLFVLNMVISKYLYLRITTRGEETTAKEYKEKKNVARQSFMSSFYYESRRTLLHSGKLATFITVIIALPLITLLLNYIFAAIDKRLMGEYLAISFDILIVVLFTTSSNVWVSSIYSKDANALVISRTFPTKYTDTLFPKLILPMIVTVLTVVPSTIIFGYMGGCTALDTFWIILIELFVCIAHVLWCAEMDFCHPHPEIYETSGNAASNPNESKSIATSFVISAVTMGVTFFFLMFSSSGMYIRVLIIAVIFFAYRLLTFMLKGKALNKREE